MSVALVVNGVTYDYPEVDDTDWGAEATDWAAAVTSGMLQKAGGLFQLLAEADFGTSYGLKSLYYKSRTANPADAGQVRLARADIVNWRNNANSGNLSLTVDASDNLTFDGNILGVALNPVDTDSIDLTVATGDISADLNLSAAAASASFLKVSNSIESDGLLGQIPYADTSTTGALTSTDWNTFNDKQASGNYITALTGNVTASGPGSAAATIAAGAIVNSMVSASAAIAYSKLALTGSIVNADVSASAAIAYSKLNLSASIVNADVASGAAIAVNKLAALTASRAVVSDGSGFLSSATTTATEIGYVNGVTSAIQTQLNAKSPTASPTFTGTVTLPLTTAGPVITSSGGVISSEAQLAVARGGTGQASGTQGGILWFNGTTSMTSSALLAANGVMVGGGVAGAPATIAAGTAGQVLISNAGVTAPSWGIDVLGSATNDSAASGYKGEFASASLQSGSATSLTNNTAKTVVSVSLTAGDWDVWGFCGFQIGGDATRVIAAISQTNNTLPSEPFLGGLAQTGFVSGAVGNQRLGVPAVRISLASTTTIYLVALSLFSTSTCTAFGSIMARRMR